MCILFVVVGYTHKRVFEILWCVRVPITLAPKFRDTAVIVETLVVGSRVADPQTHSLLGTRYIPGHSINVGIDCNICK